MSLANISPGFMVVTIAKDDFCSKTVTVIKLIVWVLCNIYDWLLLYKFHPKIMFQLPLNLFTL